MNSQTLIQTLQKISAVGEWISSPSQVCEGDNSLHGLELNTFINVLFWIGTEMIQTICSLQMMNCQTSI